MNKFRNKGVSFFELVIAVAIFAILVIPITSQLIQALKTSEKSSGAQTKYEFAENLMENVKNADSISFFSDNVVSDKSLTKLSEEKSIKKYPEVGMCETKETDSETGNEIEYDGCVLTGSAKIGSGKKAKTYYYAIDLSNKEYAERQAKVSDYSDPNKSTLAMIESLDSSKVALINGTIGNYDMTVTNAFLSKKLDILKVGDKTRWEQYTKQQAEIVAFPNDTVTRVIEISVASSDTGEKDPTTKRKLYNYTVKCKLRYKDNSNVVLKDGKYKGKTIGSVLNQEISYTPYTQTFKATDLPSVYLMYNPCMYNGNYMANDTILLDTSRLNKQEVYDVDERGNIRSHLETDADGNTVNVYETKNAYPQVNLFVVETAEQYSEQAAKSYAMIETAQDMAKPKAEATATAKTKEIINKLNPGLNENTTDLDEKEQWNTLFNRYYPDEYNDAYDDEYAKAYAQVSDAVTNGTNQGIVTAYEEKLTKIKDKYLVNNSTIRSRSASTVTFIGKKHPATEDPNDTDVVADSSETSTDSYVTIYHNFVDKGYKDSNIRTIVDNIKCAAMDPITGAGANLYYLGGEAVKDKPKDNKQLKYITDAVTSAASLYKVKIYLSDEPFSEADYNAFQNAFDPNTKKYGEPIISGTKGGK